MKKKIIILSVVLLLAVFTNSIYAESNGQIEVKIPKFNVRINGFMIDNQSNKFPMIMYNSTTYLPLTDGYCSALGLTTSWDDTNGYQISHEYDVYDQPKQELTDNNDLDANYYAEIYNSKIMVDGEEIINNEEEYPILYFRDTVYIPLTWGFIDRFPWNLYWDDEDGLGVVGNAPDVYDISIVGDWIYYTGDYNIFKIKLDGSEKTKFADTGSVYEMKILNDWIYYINGSDDSRLYKIQIDGTNKTKLSDDSIQEILAIEDWIYYISDIDYSYDEPNKVYKMKLDGSLNEKIENLEFGFLSLPTLKDGWFYYDNTEDDDKLYKTSVNGNYKVKLADATIANQQIVGDWIYYIDLPNKNLYRVKLDGSNNTRILDDELYYYLIKDDWIYYGNDSDKGKLYKIKLDGSGKTKLNNDNSEPIEVINDWIYYEGAYGVKMSLFQNLARTNINTGVSEIILPNGPEEFYYQDGIKIQGQYEDEELGQNYFNYNGAEKTPEELAQLSESIVLLHTFNWDNEITSQGSGVVISEDGLIVTNLHVISGGAYVGVVFEGMEEGLYYFTLNIIGIDPDRDLALIKLHMDNTLPIKLGDSDDISKGQEVVAIGNPYGLENTISDGIISGVRDIEGLEVIQTTTPISPGSSGGALLNMKGELLGVTSMTSMEGQNLNFAIPSKYIQELLEEETTKINMEIMENASVFIYNDASILFDCLSYPTDDEYIINLFVDKETGMDFDIFVNSSEFRTQLEEFYENEIGAIAKKYDIDEYDFNLFVRQYSFSYRYNNGKITKKEWEEDKDFTRKNSNKEDVLRINLENNFESLDPHLNSSESGYHIINNIFEGLMREEDGLIKYGIAKKYTLSEDKKTYTFELRDAKWSDGEPVTAFDFEYSWKRALDPYLDSYDAYKLFYIKGAEEYYEGTGSVEDIAIKAIDDYTLRVTLNEPLPYFPKLTTLPAYMPVRKDLVDQYSNYWGEYPYAIISNGPFSVEEYIENFKVTLVKNEEYYGAKNVKLDKVEMYMVNDHSISSEVYDEGEFDIINYWPTKEDEEDVSNKLPGLGINYYVFNLEEDAVKDVRVRKALSLAIDRKAIVDNVLDSRPVSATGIVPYGIYTSKGEDFRDLAGDYGILTEEASVNEAKKLLEEAGYPDGKDFPELVILYNETPGNKAIAEEVKVMWEKNLGITVKLEAGEWSAHLDRLSEGDYMVGRSGWLADYNDPVNFLELFISDSTMYYTGWNNTEYDQLVHDSYNASDSERDQMLLEAERILMDEMIVLPLYYYTRPVLVKDNIKNWQRTGLGYWNFRNTYIK